MTDIQFDKLIAMLSYLLGCMVMGFMLVLIKLGDKGRGQQ